MNAPMAAGTGPRVWLQNALDAHDVHVIFLPVNPKWDDFRNDARFLSIV